MSKLGKKNKTSESRSRGKGALRVYNKLREDILRMELLPGELLDEVGIGKQFNLSRSPVREALIRLSAEGLIKTLPNKSTLVAPLNIAEFSQFIDSLDLMQRATSRLAAKLRSDEDLQNIKGQQAKFEEAVANCDVLAMIEANRNFHVAISEAGKNSYFTLFYVRLLDDGRRMLRLYFRSFGDTLPSEFAGEHHQLIKAIEDKDEDRAEQLAHLHTVQVSDRFLSSLGVRHTSEMTVSIEERVHTPFV
jgi:DNA-binding GntR family transcriptional regulator